MAGLENMTVQIYLRQNSNYPDRLGTLEKSVDNSIEQTSLKITGYWIKVQYTVMASRTSNQAWSKGLDAGKGKGTAVPLQARSGPEGSRKFRFPYFMTTTQGVGKVVSLTHRPHLPPGNSPGTHFC